MFIRGLRRHTGISIPDEVALFNSIIDKAQGVYPVASSFLEHFMRSGGAPKTPSLRWLRSFKVIRKAERKNQRRFERQLVAAAKPLRDGDSTVLVDHWDARIRAWIGTELFYVSRLSMLRSKGSFTLVRQGSTVTLSGTIRHRWHDVFNWDNGHWVYIPGKGLVPIAVGRELAEADEARNFLMQSQHVQILCGTYLDCGETMFEWSLLEPKTDDPPSRRPA